MKKMDQISCNVCLDLIPLVQDGAASLDSEELVRGHAAECAACRSVLEQSQPCTVLFPDDKKVLRRINRAFLRAGMAVILSAAVFGASQALSFGIFYNIIIMPLVGVFGSFLLGKRWYFLPIGILALTPLLSMLFELFGSDWDTILGQFPGLLIFALIYALLVLVGIAISALFRFAFRKEE